MPANDMGWGETPKPEEPRKKHTVRNVVLTAAAAFAAIVVIGAVASGGGGESYDKPDEPSVTGTETPEPAPKAEPKPAPKESSERADVTRFELQAPDMIGAQYIKYTIVNHSSEVSDYVVEYDVFDKAGNRVDNSVTYEDSVDPGETVTGEDVVVSDVVAETVKITSVDRTSSFE